MSRTGSGGSDAEPPPEASGASDQVVLAAIIGAHGINGEVRLKLFAESLDSLKRHRAFQAGDRRFEMRSIRPGSGGAIAAFAGIKDRNEAEALRGQVLTVARADLPPLEEGEYYHADLIGLPCRSAIDDAPLGTVVAVENFGAGDVLEVERPNGKRAMIPFRPGVADLADGHIVADPVFLA